MQQNTYKGFTLIEMMIAMAIIGIIAGIAYPSYQDHIAKARRADATGALTSFATAMERRYTQSGSYLGAGAPNTGAPTIFSTKSPVDGSNTFYNLTISAVTANSYTLSATPTGIQANDKCGTLTLTNTGMRGITGQATGVNISDCW